MVEYKQLIMESVQLEEASANELMGEISGALGITQMEFNAIH